MKTCKKCQQNQTLDNFSVSKGNKDKLNNTCNRCRSEQTRERRNKRYFYYYTKGKESECRKKGITFDLTEEYLKSIWTGFCPIFGVELKVGEKGMGSHSSAHLDRIDPLLGYVVGNVAWISGRANRIKYNATSEELRKIADWMERATTIPKGSTQ